MEKRTETPKKEGHMSIWELAQFFLSLGRIKPDENDNIIEDDLDIDKLPLHTDTTTEHMLKMRNRFF